MNALAESRKQERMIANKYIGDFPWLMVIWGLGGFTLWLALFPLVYLDLVPLWLGAILATVILCGCYLPSHDAQHDIIARPATSLRWLNELVGHLSVMPMLIPYRLHRAIHLKHHAYTNDPEKDPDIYIKAETLFGAIKNIWLSKQSGSGGGLKLSVLDDTPQKKRLIIEAMLVNTGVWVFMAILCWLGFGLEVLVLWWIPKTIANYYIPLLLSWAPHHPMLETGRYRDTRGWKSPMGLLLSAGMEYHIVHHLFPRIPLNKTPAAYREMEPLLAEAGARLPSSR